MADVDECDMANACGVGENCVNTVGGFSCDCKMGYVKEDGACVKGKLLKKESLICALKELQDRHNNNNNLISSEKCSLVNKIKAQAFGYQSVAFQRMKMLARERKYIRKGVQKNC